MTSHDRVTDSGHWERKLACQDWLWLSPTAHIMTFQKSPRLSDEQRPVAGRVWAGPNNSDSGNLMGRSLLIPAQESGRDVDIHNNLHTELFLPFLPRLAISLEWWTAQQWRSWLGLNLHRGLNLLDDNERHQGYVQDVCSIEIFWGRVFFVCLDPQEDFQWLLRIKIDLWNGCRVLTIHVWTATVAQSSCRI